MKKTLTAFFVLLTTVFNGFAVDMSQEINSATEKILPQVVEWRRHLHQNPELGNREFKTAGALQISAVLIHDIQARAKRRTPSAARLRFAASWSAIFKVRPV